MRSSWRQWRLTLCNSRSLPKSASCREEFQVTNVHFMQDVLRNWQIAKAEMRAIEISISHQNFRIDHPNPLSKNTIAQPHQPPLVINFFKVPPPNQTKLTGPSHPTNHRISRLNCCTIGQCRVHPWKLLILILLTVWVCSRCAPAETRPIAAHPITHQKLSTPFKHS